MLLALDRSLIFSLDNIRALFYSLDEQRQGQVSIRHRIRRMLRKNRDLDEDEEDADKVDRLHRSLVDLRICRDPEVDDLVGEVQFLYICRDIFGINTFEIEYELPELEGSPEEQEEVTGAYIEGSDPVVYEDMMESPNPDQQVQMSAIRETTGEYRDDEERWDQTAEEGEHAAYDHAADSADAGVD